MEFQPSQELVIMLTKKLNLDPKQIDIDSLDQTIVMQCILALGHDAGEFTED
ncbi:hypothetical protein KJ707_03680 [Patescibacteria group bacterium]|nr:hypothetical protein [Patescibacteria group bacterium]MBU2543633.1 hypothetical protein [Patescibacteria group bacterium]